MTVGDIREMLTEFDDDTIVVDHNGWIVDSADYRDALHFEGSDKVALSESAFVRYYRREYPNAREIVVLRLG